VAIPGPISVSSDYTVADQQRMTQAKRYFAWQSDLSKAQLGRRVLEVGCGLGNFTERLLDRDRVIGIDIDPNCIEHHRARFARQPHIESRVLDALDPAFLDLRREAIDSVVCLNVLEHIEDDLTVLQRMQQILPPGGRVILIIPAFMALYGPIDQHLGHYRRYTRRGLIATAEKAGLRPRLLHYMNTVGFFGWWLNAKMKRQEQSEAQIATFDNYIVPVMARLEGWVKPPFGQSLFAVLEKP
jgi:SAM-dependent methyltransferase